MGQSCCHVHVWWCKHGSRTEACELRQGCAANSQSADKPTATMVRLNLRLQFQDPRLQRTVIENQALMGLMALMAVYLAEQRDADCKRPYPPRRHLSSGAQPAWRRAPGREVPSQGVVSMRS